MSRAGRDGGPGHALFGRAFPCDCTLEEFNAYRGDRDAQASRATLPQGAARQTFATFKANLAPEAAKAANEWAEGIGPPWLILRGKPGTGKTHLCFAAGLRLIERGLRVYYAVVPDLMTQFGAHIGLERRLQFERERGDRDVPDCESFDRKFQDVLTADALILDDLGTQKSTEFTESKLFELVDSRYRNETLLMVATNAKLDDLPPRLVSRFRDRALSRLVWNNAVDHRPAR